jgi:hypothetical protein
MKRLIHSTAVIWTLTVLPAMVGPLFVLPFLCTVAYVRRPGMLPILSALGLKNTN